MIHDRPATRIQRELLADLDRNDPLAAMREAFVLPAGIIYMDGNSLGACPKGTAERMEGVVREEWGEGLIRSWNAHDWIHLPLRLGAKIARLVGAEDHEVAVADSTSVNLFKMLAAALRMQSSRRVIVSEAGNFPSDLYMIQGLIGLLGGRHELRLADPEDIESAIDTDVAVVSLTHVNYKTSLMHDMPAITAAAHARGAMVIWDLAHSAGSMPIDLNGCGVDLAVGCGYKFLNGGPGAPAFLFVADRHQEAMHQPLTGWLGHARPFEFEPEYKPAAGIGRALCGTPAVLSMSALEAGVDVAARADLREVRRKSMALGDLFLSLVEQECGGHGLEVACPVDATRRGSQVGLRHPNGYPIVQALIARGVIGDFRTPDVLRFGITPLYQRYVDIWDAVQALRSVLETGTWRAPEFHRRATVT